MHDGCLGPSQGSLALSLGFGGFGPKASVSGVYLGFKLVAQMLTRHNCISAARIPSAVYLKHEHTSVPNVGRA